MAAYVFYNPLAGNGSGETVARDLTAQMGEHYLIDMTKITNYEAIIAGMGTEDYLVIVGGDGTLNRFANETAKLRIQQQILYYPMGTGNDFARDLGKETGTEPFAITNYLKNLPSVEVKGKTYRFINGVGYGIDGYCCQVGDEQKQIPGKKVDYTAIAIKGLLFFFNARNAKVTVDGVELGYMGQIHPLVAKNYGIDVDVYCAEINFTKLLGCLLPDATYTPLPKYPGVSRDISVICDEALTVGQAEQVITASAGKLLRGVKLFDVYRGTGVPEGKKSLAFSLELRADDRTLTDTDSEGVVTKVLTALKEKLNAVLR